MRKAAIIFVLALVGIIGVWVYCLFGAPDWLKGFARGGTRAMASTMGMHVFEETAPAAATGAAAPKKETVTNLPDGFYVYMGPTPMQSTPKWVSINPGGTISWLNNAPASAPATQQVAAGTPVPAGAAEYPTVKFNAKPLNDKGAIAQLWTTFDPVEHVVKYRLTILKGDSNEAHEVQLLDANGFKVSAFTAGDFHSIPGSDLMESRDNVPLEEAKYRQVRDYSLR